MNLDSTIRDLRLYESEIEVSHLGKEIVQRFKENPELPGIILTEHSRFITSISQRSFWEQMSRPYSLELFLKRPIWCLYNSNSFKRNSLILPADISIGEAVRSSLQRPAKLLDEPIVVEIQPQVYRLLDAHQLLVAHAQIYELVTKMLVQLYDRLETISQQKTNSPVDNKKKEGNLYSIPVDVSRESNYSPTLQNLLQFANRYQFEEYLQQQWQQGVKKHIWISLIICCVNFFAGVSKPYNPEAESKYLRQIGAIIKQSVESLEGFAINYGESQFAVILSNMEASEVTHTIEKIRRKIAESKVAGNDTPIGSYCTISFGVGRMIPSSLYSPETLITIAEQALEQAQKNGQTYKVIWH